MTNTEKLKSIKLRMASAKIELSTNGITENYLRLMVSYHDEYAEYYDSRIGDVSNNDDEYTRKWNWHCNKMNGFFNQLQKLEFENQMEQRKIDNAPILAQIRAERQQNEKCDKCGKLLLECECELTHVKCDFCGTENIEIDKTTIVCDEHGYGIFKCNKCLNDSFGECLKSDHPQLCEKPQSEMVTKKIQCPHNYECENHLDNVDDSDELSDSFDTCPWQYTDGMECLEQFNILYDESTKTFTYPLNLNLVDVLNIVNGACDILDNCEQYDMESVDNVIGDWDVDEYRFPDESKQYYIEHMMEHGDDTAFDYHGTYVIAILDYLMGNKIGGDE